ncbi:AraC family transcriptional regulator [Paractinoplanes rishiriensis]|uniref:AraC family transcriptional regulator n=1 Tax=Paractinoplanes rishiriensis TaxID=1050105 RepID=A0A919MRU2_9ACTN|nr:helix-turn-helix domain-containing protein [Actinoplanes rishiriensis]GIE92948.1 AraC family transcriptional regulator [Actinoplanes rishiriensis]
MIRADVMRVLVHVEAHLDRDLSAPALAAAAGLSASRFHRVFVAEIGETPHAYVARLRLDRAALYLATQAGPIAGIAAAVGYETPETFARAFARRFATTPSAYRAAVPVAAPLPARRPGLEQQAGEGVLSAVRVTELRPQPAAFLRHLGPYEDVDGSLFEDLAAWSHGRTGVTGPWLGVGHDAPGITPARLLRFDACLGVTAARHTRGRVAFQTVPGGWYAVATHTGPYTSLPQAHRSVYATAQSFAGYRVAGLPLVECYLTSTVRPDAHLNTTQIRLPLVRLAR